jgi:multidrug efflux pump subunit AcrA (membrane-fusion protein)
MGIKVTFFGAEPEQKNGVAEPAVLIPQAAVRDDQGKKIVFLVKNDHLERRAIGLGGTRGSDAEVLAGLDAGDTVVVKGPATLHDGEAVEIKK